MDPFTPIEECTCPCLPERDGLCQYLSKNCYQSVCPAGTYLCCYACTFSQCTRNFELTHSTRGVRECVICPPGHFCDGCDLPRACPDGTSSSNQGNVARSDCIPCDSGKLVSPDRTVCCEPGSCLVTLGVSPNYVYHLEESSDIPVWSILPILIIALIHGVL